MIEQKVREAIRRGHWLSPGDKVLVAVSGGADSVVLLRVLLLLAPAGGWQVAAAHVHHGLRGDEADRDEAFVRRLCADWKTPLFVRHADVAAEAAARGEGLEEAGRRVRYAFFEELCVREGFSRVATAHTASDNVETLLLHLARGSGLKGMGGIRPQMGRIIRPLLDCSRGEIEAYCRENNLAFVVDGTNADTTYSRNRIRLQAVPALRAVNPRLEEAAARLARAARLDEDFLQGQAAALLRAARLDDGIYDRTTLAAAHPALTRRALATLAGSGAQERHVLQLEELLSADGWVNLPGDWRAHGEAGQLIFGPARPQPAGTVEKRPIKPGDCCEICGRLYQIDCLSLEEYEKKKKIHKNLLKSSLDYDKIIDTMFLRGRLPADRYHPVGRQGGKSLKKLFGESGIPPQERDAVPILCDGAGIVLVPGFGCDERVRIDAATRQVLCFYAADGCCR